MAVYGLGNIATVPNAKKRLGIPASMVGSVHAFGSQPPQLPAHAMETPTPSNYGPSFTPLPDNYGFNDLANYEENRRNAFGRSAEAQILARRNSLANSLTQFGQKQFEQANPGILEDLNSRGFLSSPTEVARAQAQALKEISLQGQDRLFDLDTSATAANLQAQQDALDAGLDLRRGKLEGKLQNEQASREEALARDLAKQQGRNSLYGSLIGAGGSIGGGYLGAKAYAAKTAAPTALPTGTTAYGAPLASGAEGPVAPTVATASKFGPGGSLLNTAGTSTFGAGNILPGFGGYYAGTRTFKPTQEGDQSAENVGGVIGGVGGSAFGPVGSAVGAYVGTGVGKANNRLVKGIDKSLGNSAGSVARYSNPFTGIPAGYNKAKDLIKDPSGTISKVFGGGGKKDAVVNLPKWSMPSVELPADTAAASAVKGILSKKLSSGGSYHEGTISDALTRLDGLKKLKRNGTITPEQYQQYTQPIIARAKIASHLIMSASSEAATAARPGYNKLKKYFSEVA